MDLKDTYNKIAEDWTKDHGSDTWWIGGTDRFVSFLKPGSSVLDVGCASGVKAKYLAAKGLSVTGFDFSEKMIEIAKREVPSARFLVADIRDLSGINEAFDGIFAQAVLLHIPKKEIRDIMKGLLAKLKNGGYLYAAVKGRKPGGPEEAVKEEEDYGYKYERFFSYFTPEEMKKYFSDLSLEVVYEDSPSTKTDDWIQLIGRKIK